MINKHTIRSHSGLFIKSDGILPKGVNDYNKFSIL